MIPKTALITGATDGIGLETARSIAAEKHHLIIHGRSQKSVNELLRQLRIQFPNTRINGVWANLASFDEIFDMSELVRLITSKLDVLINNAGVFEHDRQLLDNGFEKTFMVNHLAYHAVTLRLMPLLLNSKRPRLVNVSSMAQASNIDFDNLNGEKFYEGYDAYARSKLCNVLFTYKVKRLLSDSPLQCFCLHPGVIRTKLLRKGFGAGLGNPLAEGAANLMHAAFNPDLNDTTEALYFVNQTPASSSKISYNQKVQDRLWEYSVKATGLGL